MCPSYGHTNLVQIKTFFRHYAIFDSFLFYFQRFCTYRSIPEVPDPTDQRDRGPQGGVHQAPAAVHEERRTLGVDQLNFRKSFYNGLLFISICPKIFSLYFLYWFHIQYTWRFLVTDTHKPRYSIGLHNAYLHYTVYIHVLYTNMYL